MPEKHFTVALSLAMRLFNTREQFVDVLRAAATARIEAIPARGVHAFHAGISRRAIEPHVDDALYAIGRDGLSGLEDNIRHVVDEIVREALDAAKETQRR